VVTIVVGMDNLFHYLILRAPTFNWNIE